MSACSSVLVNENQRKDAFLGKARAAKESSPLPVEIAREIARISEEGALVYKSDVANLNPVVQPIAFCYKREDCELKLKYRPPAQVKEETVSSRIARMGKGKGPLMRGVSSKGPGPLDKKSGGKGKTVTYIVKWGDTLMEIAFEKYANYLKWKDIYRVNKHKMKSPRKMQVGTELSIENVKYVYIKKDGKPYLIKKEDTLKSISQKLYGTPDRWKEIWKNNPQLIRNPKKIYAGFTLYYNPDKMDTIELREPAKAKSKN